MKKTLSLLLALVMVLSMIPLTVFAETTTLTEGYPGALEAGAGTTVSFDAPSDGEAKFTIYASTGVKIVGSDKKECGSSTASSGTHEITVEVAEGSNTFYIYGWDGTADCDTSIIMYSVEMDVEEEETDTTVTGDGSLINPYIYESVEALVADWTGKTIGAGEVVYVQAPLGGATLTVTSDTTAACLYSVRGIPMAYDSEAFTFGEEMGLADGDTYVVGIYNQNPRGEAVVTLIAGASEGSDDSDDTTESGEAALVMGSNSVDAADITYTYTATEDGTLSLTAGAAIMGMVEFEYAVNGGEAEILELSSTVDLTLAAGDVVIITVTAEGYSSLTAAWTAASTDEGDGEGEGEDEGGATVEPDGSQEAPYVIESLPTTLEVELTDDNALDGIFYQYTATEDGTVSYETDNGYISSYVGAYNGDNTDYQPSSPVEIHKGETITINVWFFSECVCNVSVTFEAGEIDTDEPTEVEVTYYENVATPTPYSIAFNELEPRWVNITEVGHTAVLGNDGYYHLDAADGDIIVVNMAGYYYDYDAGTSSSEDDAVAESLIDYAAAAAEGRMLGYIYDEDDSVSQKLNYCNSIMEYYNAQSNDGWVYLTEDLISFYKNYGKAQGWYMNGLTPYLSDVDFDADSAWMFACATVTGKTVDMHRLYNPNSGEHFYTGSVLERENLIKAGWRYEGVAWQAPVDAEEGLPIYRLYNPNTGDHHYTGSEVERDMLVEAGWRYENVAWNTPIEGIAVHRLYNPNANVGTHHYTADEDEVAMLVEEGWRYENVAWNGVY